MSGGIADYTADDGIEVVLFDMDNYRDDPKNTDKVPASFCVDCGPVYEARMAREGRCALVNLPEARQNRIRGLRNE